MSVQKRSISTQILHGLSNPPRDPNTLYGQLQQLADQTTCHLHKGQIEKIASKWYEILRTEMRRLRAPSTTLAPSTRLLATNGTTQTATVTHTRRTITTTVVEEQTSVSLSRAPLPSANDSAAFAAAYAYYDAVLRGAETSTRPVLAAPSPPAVTTSPAIVLRSVSPPTSAPPTANIPAQDATRVAVRTETASNPPRPVSSSNNTSSTTASSSSAPQASAGDHSPSHTAATEDDPCSICREPLTEPYRTPCGHTYCKECISAWFDGASHKTCPMDRRPLAWTELVEVEDKQCSICMDEMVDPCKTPCGHRFCRGCMRDWFGGAAWKTCPMDRRRLGWSELTFEGDAGN